MTEIAYAIDPIASKDFNDMLVIRLMEVKKEGMLPTLQPFKQPLLLSTLKSFLKANDQSTIDALIQEELLFQKTQTGRTPQKESTSFHLIHISAHQSIPLLKLMAQTKKLYFNGKQLTTDFLGQADFFYRLKPTSEQGLEVSGRLKWRDQNIAITDCEWIGKGKPLWFIRGVLLKTISTDISWKELQQCHEKAVRTLSKTEKQAFLKNIDPEDPDCPQIEMEGSTLQEASRAPDPFPILKLRDRSGAFADLWMDYGDQTIAFHSHEKELIFNEGMRIKRNESAEKSWEKDLLETNFIRKDVSNSHYYCPIDKVAKSLSFLLELGWKICDWKEQQVVKQQSFELHLQEHQQTLAINGNMRYDTYETNVKDVLGAFNRRERFIQLGQGRVGLLPDRWEQPELQELAEEGEIVKDQLIIKKSRIGGISHLLNHAEKDSTLHQLKHTIQQFSHIEEAIPGPGFNGQLRHYQQQGLNWLTFLVQYGLHGMLADDMGLGKTVQVIALLSRLPKTLPHLIIVPTSLIFNWKNEFEKFLPGSSLYVHQGPKRHKNPSDLQSYSMILTSYTTIRLDLPLFQQLSYHSIILDEAQTIKNAHTQTSQAICCLDGQFRLSITGTPIENHLHELWSHFHFLIPDLFGDESSFDAELLAAQSDTRYLQRIKKKIHPFILRRKKEEVAKDLPERIDQVVWVEMSDTQRRIYDEFLAGVKNGLLKKVALEGISKHRIEVFEVILRLRQICCHPLLVSSSEISSESTSAKFEALMQDLETAAEEGRKVLVYSQFTSMLQLIAKTLKNKGQSYAYLDGSTVNRETVVDSFQKDASIPFFLISLKAGGVGLNLTSADYVFLYDPWWNEAVEEQAINRAHRIGRKDTVIAKRFITAESIEEKMMKLKSLKRGIADTILDDEVGTASLTIEDLYYLLE